MESRGNEKSVGREDGEYSASDSGRGRRELERYREGDKDREGRRDRVHERDYRESDRTDRDRERDRRDRGRERDRDRRDDRDRDRDRERGRDRGRDDERREGREVTHDEFGRARLDNERGRDGDDRRREDRHRHDDRQERPEDSRHNRDREHGRDKKRRLNEDEQIAGNGDNEGNDDGIAEEIDFAALGLPTGFNSTKGKHVEGNIAGEHIQQSDRKYRQYMNRKGGFNKILDEDKNVERHSAKHVAKEQREVKKSFKSKGPELMEFARVQ